MKLSSHNISEGVLDDICGCRGAAIFKESMPNHSFHLAWEGLPEGTSSLALTFLDYEAVPVCGFPWIHWTVADIDPTLSALKENASVEGDLLEGVNSWVSKLLPDNFRLAHDEATAYGGSAPPDKPHVYEVTMYALNKKLGLKRGFYLNELLAAMDGHVLEKATLKFIYLNKD